MEKIDRAIDSMKGKQAYFKGKLELSGILRGYSLAKPNFKSQISKTKFKNFLIILLN